MKIIIFVLSLSFLMISGQPVASIPSLAVTTTASSLSATVSSSSAATDATKANSGNGPMAKK